jgi:hypothetical protein
MRSATQDMHKYWMSPARACTTATAAAAETAVSAPPPRTPQARARAPKTSVPHVRNTKKGGQDRGPVSGRRRPGPRTRPRLTRSVRTHRPRMGSAAPPPGTPPGMSKHTPMDKDAAARIQSAGARDPGSDTAADEFDRRAQSAADRNDNER